MENFFGLLAIGLGLGIGLVSIAEAIQHSFGSHKETEKGLLKVVKDFVKPKNLAQIIKKTEPIDDFLKQQENEQN